MQAPGTNLTKDDIAAALRELHERPSVDVAPDDRIFHFAFRCSDELCLPIANLLTSQTQANVPRYSVGRLRERPAKLERHLEFYSLTLFANQQNDARPLLRDILGSDDFLQICAVELSVNKSAATLLKSVPVGERPIGGLMRGKMHVQTTLKPQEQSWTVFQVCPAKCSAHELGRRLQRLLEMETYRVLCLAGLESARKSGATLARLEAALDNLVGDDKENKALTHQAQSRLNELSEISSRLTVLRAGNRFRISASEAYYDLVVQRLDSVEEQQVGDLQTISGFVRARLDPAIATIRSLKRRQLELAGEINNALTLLRTHIELDLNRSNHESLVSMDKRHHQQVLISQAVEGLSIVAISYYAVGLIGYILKAASVSAMLPVSPTIATGISVPVVVLGVALFLRRMRRHWTAGNHSNDR